MGGKNSTLSDIIKILHVGRSGFVRVMASWKSHGFLFCKIKAFKSHGKLYFIEKSLNSHEKLLFEL